MLSQIAQVLSRPVELVAIAEPLAPQRDFFSASYGYAKSFDDGLELIANADINLKRVVVISPRRACRSPAIPGKACAVVVRIGHQLEHAACLRERGAVELLH